MELIFETKLGKVYQSDCLDYMRECKENEFDLCFTDPPYGIKVGRNKPFGKVGGNKPFGKVDGNKICEAKEYITFDDSKIPEKEIFDEIMRISKNQIIFGGNYFIEYLKNTSCFLVWDKDNTGNFADCELAWTSFKTAVRKFKYRWNGLLQENMKNKETRYHPTQKPVELYAQILKKYSEPTQTVFDGFAGSGTLGVCCEQLGMRYVLVEKKPEYCDIIIKRLKKVTNTLF